MSFYLRNKNNQKGFSLIELLLAILIVSLLSSVAFLSYGKNQKEARDAKRMSDLTSLQDALEAYYDDKGLYPSCSGESSVYCQDITSGANPFNICVCTNAALKVSPNYGDFSGIGQIFGQNFSPYYIREIPQDPIDNATYSYLYVRGYKKVSDSSITVTSRTSDYILATHRESAPACTTSTCLTLGSWTFNTVLGN